jgi:Icc-related predicted phosphoesterase
MKIDFISDLHVEINGPPKWLTWPDERGEILILAGDITCFRFFQDHRVDAESRTQRNQLKKFLENECSTYERIIWIPGNHEYYGYHLGCEDQMQTYMRKEIDDRITIAQDSLIDLDYDTTLFAATLWTDFDKGNPLAMMDVENCLNDYHLINHGDINKTKIRGYHTQMLHAETLKKLKEHVDQLSGRFKYGRSGRLIVATHHGPSMQSHDHKRFGLNDNICYGFLSDLDRWIETTDIPVWIHGHTHFNVDYMINKTHIVSAQYGYLGSDRRPKEFLQVGQVEV